MRFDLYYIKLEDRKREPAAVIILLHGERLALCKRHVNRLPRDVMRRSKLEDSSRIGEIRGDRKRGGINEMKSDALGSQNKVTPTL